MELLSGLRGDVNTTRYSRSVKSKILCALFNLLLVPHLVLAYWVFPKFSAFYGAYIKPPPIGMPIFSLWKWIVPLLMIGSFVFFKMQKSDKILTYTFLVGIIIFSCMLFLVPVFIFLPMWNMSHLTGQQGVNVF